MILVADSGSTKCDWQVVNGKTKSLSSHTIGINPFFHDEDTIASFINQNQDLVDIAPQVSKVYFYCAGGSIDELNKRVEIGLKRVFSNAEISVGHDLNGAAISCYKGFANITCILGTGSNSVYFDGKHMHEEVPALAYILGDEGSGSYFGKKLLADYLYKKLPKEIEDVLHYDLKLTKNDILENVYMKPYANVYLAGFTKIIHRFLHLSYVNEMISEGMNRFLRIHVTCFKDYNNLPVNFVGSVAYYFNDILREEAKKLNITIGIINKKPIEGLTAYHIEHQYDKIIK